MAANANRDSWQVDEVLRRRFEQAWQSALIPVLEEFLPPDTTQHATLIELVCIDIERRWQRRTSGSDLSDPPSIENYLDRFPCLRQAEAAKQLIEQELQMRRGASQPVDFSDYARRFPEACALLETRLIERAGRPSPLTRPLEEAPPLPSVLGSYELLERIGEGGMGWVYRARHKRLSSLAAVKILKLKINESRDVLARFVREGRAAASLRHPHIATAFDAGEDGPWNFIAFEFLEGENLRQIVVRDGPLSPPLAIAYLRQAAAGLAHAHDQGIVHRDVKPANIMLERTGNIKVLDLGLAAVRSHQDGLDVTTVDALMGTIDYMAPEQGLDPRRANAQSDIYSLGCTLYYLLTGKPMFIGETEMERLIAHREQPIPALREARPDAPPELEELYRKLVAKHPQDRYATMKEVIGACDSLDFSNPSPAARQPQVRNWPWKWPVVAAGALVVILFVAWLLGQSFNLDALALRHKDRDHLQKAGKILDLGGSFDTIINGEQVNVATVEQIPKPPFQITAIELQGGRATEDDILALLPGLELTQLRLKHCQLTSDGLRKIVKFTPALETLDLGGTNLAQVDPSPLAELRHLQTVWIGRTGVGDDTAQALSKIESLEYVWIGETSVSNEGVRAIAALPHLQGLGLEDTRVTVEGLKPLESTSLHQLILDGLPITDDDVDHLARLSGLTSLKLSETGITNAGLKRLRNLLPGCDIKN
jgi:serine/threonine protein kinase